MKNFLYCVFLLWIASQTFGQTSNYPVVHTGVSEFYDAEKIIEKPTENEFLYWQDAGRVVNPPSYTNNGDGTVTDNITGLMWQQDMGGKITYTDALLKADALTIGGYDDWRIPTIKELYSLILFTGHLKGENADKMFIDTNYFNQPLGDVSIGEREIDGQTWSSTHYAGLTMNKDSTVFGVNFIDGRIKGYPKYNPRSSAPNAMYFRMVRGNPQYGENNFKNNEDGTVTDLATNLMWQKADDGIGRDWLDAISYCKDLDLASNKDWHLPNAKELQSIVDYSRSPSATQSPAIDPIFEVSEINDPEGNPGHYPYYWSSTTHLDGANPYSGAAYIAFGKALGEMNGKLLDVHGAGAQRSDPKVIEDGKTYPQYHGPQGDLRVVLNHCRCVRKVDISTGMNPQSIPESVRIYPNPTKGLITIEAGDGISVKIFDILGNQIARFQTEKSDNIIDISGYRGGLYFAQISNGVQTVIRKIVKE